MRSSTAPRRYHSITTLPSPRSSSSRITRCATVFIISPSSGQRSPDETRIDESRTALPRRLRSPHTRRLMEHTPRQNRWTFALALALAASCAPLTLFSQERVNTGALVGIVVSEDDAVLGEAAVRLARTDG